MRDEECEEFLELVLEIGKRYVQTGAEIKRVEDSIRRLCVAYGFENVEIYAVTSLIVATIKNKNGKHYTQSARVYNGGTDLGHLEEINAQIRDICNTTPSISELRDIIYNSKESKPKPILKCFGYMLAAGGFAIFFGGNLIDGLAAAIIAIAIYLMDYHFKIKNINNVVYTFIASFVSGCLALLLVHFKIGDNIDKVMIGDIMLFIPGLLLVNAVKEMFNKDIVTGIYRFVEAIFVAISIAGGFAVSVITLGGVL